MGQSSEGEQEWETNLMACGKAGGADCVQGPLLFVPRTFILLVCTKGWTSFVVCPKSILPNWPVDISKIKEEDVSDEEVVGVQELHSELPATELAEHNAEGTPDDAVPEDASSLVTSPYKWVVEAANYLYPTSGAAFSEALDMMESVSNRSLLFQVILRD